MPLSDLKYLLSHKSFDPTLPTAVYVHGWLESGKMDLSTLAVRGAYIDRGDHNVVTVDWSYYSKNINYHVSVIPQLKVIAETIAESILMLVKNGCDIQMMHLVGHSLGCVRDKTSFIDNNNFFYQRSDGRKNRSSREKTNGRKICDPQNFRLRPGW